MQQDSFRHSASKMITRHQILSAAAAFSARSRVKSWSTSPVLTQAALQNFAWTERSRVQIQAERNAQCSTDAQREALLAEPVFCFETACKALYWSILVYRLQARRLSGWS